MSRRGIPMAARRRDVVGKDRSTVHVATRRREGQVVGKKRSTSGSHNRERGRVQMEKGLRRKN